MKYRAEIDGLRAFAVVPVILFHAGFEWFRGGFVGVDVFFVISGYLITSILIDDIQNKKFSIVEFYERRARRILPALFFIMFLCIPFAWMYLLPSQMKDFSQSLVAVSLFASNILFWSESGYFDTATEDKPLLHTWSLAVEEQYYVLFPIFLVLAWRFGKNRVFWSIVILASLSLALSEWSWRNAPNANFYLATTRAWELFAGSISAFMVHNKGVRANNMLAFGGLLAILFAIFFFDESTPFPSIYALVPVIGVVLIILFADGSTLVSKFLSLKLFVGIGLVSYSAYLWHQPIFAFSRIASIGHLNAWVMLALSVLSVLLAVLSWKFIENPFRNKKRFSRAKIFQFSALAMVFFISVGLLGHLYSPSINSGSFSPYAKLEKSLQLPELYEIDNQVLRLESWALLREVSQRPNYAFVRDPFDNELWFEQQDSRKKVLVVGNSHSKDLYNVLRYSESVMSDYQLARYGEQIKHLTQSHAFFSSPNYRAADYIVVATRYDAQDLEHLPTFIDILRADGKTLILTKTMFEFRELVEGKWSLIDELVLSSKAQKPPQLALHDYVNQAYYAQYANQMTTAEVKRINQGLSKIAQAHSEVLLLDRMDYVCNAKQAMCFALSAQAQKHFYDYAHHTLVGSQYFGQRVDTLKWFTTATSQ